MGVSVGVCKTTPRVTAAPPHLGDQGRGGGPGRPLAAVKVLRVLASVSAPEGLMLLPSAENSVGD